MDDNKNMGWICPRCKTVNSPQKEKCQCVQVESSETKTAQLLVE